MCLFFDNAYVNMATVVNLAMNMNILPCLISVKLFKEGLSSAEVGCRNLSYINNSLHLARKYARIFVRGHYLGSE